MVFGRRNVSQGSFQPSEVVDSTKVEQVLVPCLLPHEILYALSNAGEEQACVGDFQSCSTSRSLWMGLGTTGFMFLGPASSASRCWATTFLPTSKICGGTALNLRSGLIIQ